MNVGPSTACRKLLGSVPAGSSDCLVCLVPSHRSSLRVPLDLRWCAYFYFEYHALGSARMGVVEQQPSSLDVAGYQGTLTTRIATGTTLVCTVVISRLIGNAHMTRSV